MGDTERRKFKHTQTVDTTSIAEAVEMAKQEAYSHYNSVGLDATLDDEEPKVKIVVEVRGTYVASEIQMENHLLKEEVARLRQQLPDKQ